MVIENDDDDNDSLSKISNSRVKNVRTKFDEPISIKIKKYHK